MTPPDQPDEQPSALSRLERALAGFGDPTRAATDPEPEAAGEVATDEKPEAEPTQGDDVDDPDEEWAPSGASSSSVLDIAGAVEAIERLTAAQEAANEAEPEHAEPRSAIEALDEKWAKEEDAEELPRFEPADLRARIKEFEEEDEDATPAADDAEPAAGLPGEVAAVADEPLAEEPLADDSLGDDSLGDDAARGGRPDAAAGWQRDLGDTTLPYFLVEDNRPVAAEPVATATARPTIEELRALPTTAADEPHNASVLRTLAEIPILLIVAALIAFLVKTFLAQAYYIPSGSMLPQLRIDDRVVVSKLAYKAHDPRRGDIIVFDDPRNGDSTDGDEEGLLRKIGEGIGIVQPSTDEFIKRVIGLPGETVEARDGHVFINGRRLYEPYLDDSVVTSDFPETKVKAGHLWVMGDNRSGSADSRVFGQIDVDTIVGRAVVTVWPFGHAEFL